MLIFVHVQYDISRQNAYLNHVVRKKSELLTVILSIVRSVAHKPLCDCRPKGTIHKNVALLHSWLHFEM